MYENGHSHAPEDIRERLRRGPSVSYLREWVYGGIDGIVTTFAIIAGVSGANLAAGIVLILGLANLLGDGFSMAAGCYTGTKTDIDNYKRLKEVEASQIALYPQGEAEEIRQIYAAKGLSGQELEAVVKAVTRDRTLWIDEMMSGEYGFSPVQKSPLRAAGHTFLSFLLCGSAPLIPFLLKVPEAFHVSLFLSAASFFAIGSFKSRWSVKSWKRSGFEAMAIGLTAAGIAYGIGYGLRNLGL